MGKQTIIESIKEWLAGICWKYFLKLNNLTENEYFSQIKEQESNSGTVFSYASPASSGVQNGGQWQKCPKCDGQGIVSKPTWVAGDVTEWTSTQTSYPCDLCNGIKVIKQ